MTEPLCQSYNYKLLYEKREDIVRPQMASVAVFYERHSLFLISFFSETKALLGKKFILVLVKRHIFWSFIQGKYITRNISFPDRDGAAGAALPRSCSTLRRRRKFAKSFLDDPNIKFATRFK